MGEIVLQNLGERRVKQSPREKLFYNDPYSLYSRLHHIGGPVYWEDYGFWCLTEFDAVNDALRSSKFARLPPPGTDANSYGSHLKDFAEIEEHSLLALEPPKHTRIRKAVNQAFVNRRVTLMETDINALANQLIDGFESLDEVDLLTAYATPLPVTVIARLLGVPDSERELLLAWSHAMVRVYTLTQTIDEEVAANKASVEFRELLIDLIKARRRKPTEDLLSQLANANQDALIDEEIVSTAVLLLNAGHEATVHQIGNTIKTLLSLDFSRSWIDDKKAGDKLIAEAMRFDPPLHLFTRYAQETVEIYEGISVAKGDQIALLLGAANRCPKRFSAADTFNPNRADAASVAFGTGLHFCVGATLAKLEMRIALNTLFKRLPNLKLQDTPRYQDSFHFHGLEALNVTF